MNPGRAASPPQHQRAEDPLARRQRDGDQRAYPGAECRGCRLEAVAGDQARLAAADRLPGQRAGQRRRPVHQSRGQRAGDAGHDHLVRVMGHGQDGEVRVRGVRGVPGDQGVRPSPVFGQQQRRQLGGGVEPAAALLGFGEPPRVRDRRAGGCGERDRQFLIVCGELPARAALGEVQVAEDLLPDADRDAEEAAHRRVPRREPRRRGMSAEAGEPDRDRLADQQAQDPPAAGQVADRRHQVVVHAGVHELLKLPVAAEHAERRVPGTEKIPGRADDLPQHHRQAQVAGYQGIGAQQPAQPPLRGQHVAGPVHQLHQQLLQLQPRHVGKAQPAGRVRGPCPARRRTVLTCRGGHRCSPSGRHWPCSAAVPRAGDHPRAETPGRRGTGEENLAAHS